ncbi:MAG TPA: 1-deoxy-D-xylulose-5-phosphate reductoisomerase, partial [Acidimicrobiales bacterium]
MKTVSLVGSTGSIGTQAIDVVEADPDRFRVVALAAQRSVDQLVEQARRLRPELVVIGDPALVPEVAAQLPPSVEVMGGAEGLEAAGTAADVIVNG